MGTTVNVRALNQALEVFASAGGAGLKKGVIIV